MGLVWGSEPSCPGTLPRKSPGLRVKHFTTEPRRAPQPFWRAFQYFLKDSICRLQTRSLWNDLKFVVWQKVFNSRLNLFRHNPFPDDNFRLFQTERVSRLQFQL